MPKYFGYEQAIKEELERRGASVYMFFENIADINYFYGIVSTFLPKRMPSAVLRYVRRKMAHVPDDVDVLFLIRGKHLIPEIMDFIVSRLPDDCLRVMYQWDSTSNLPNSLAIAPYFHRISTFDEPDAKKYGWRYRPLFYIDSELQETREKDIDILFVGSLHSERALILRKLKELCRENGYVLYSRLVLRKIVFLVGKYLGRHPDKMLADDRDVSSRQFSIREMYALYARSKVVVDYTNPHQTGFTMRTIESLGCGCKLVTNNAKVLEADFYHPGDIFCYSGIGDFSVPGDLVQITGKSIDPEITKRYSIRQWVNEVVG